MESCQAFIILNAMKNRLSYLVGKNPVIYMDSVSSLPLLNIGYGMVEK